MRKIVIGIEPRRHDDVEVNLLVDALGGSSNIAVDVTARDIDKNEADQLPIFAADERRAHFVSNLGNQRDRNMRHEAHRRI